MPLTLFQARLCLRSVLALAEPANAASALSGCNERSACLAEGMLASAKYPPVIIACLCLSSFSRFARAFGFIITFALASLDRGCFGKAGGGSITLGNSSPIGCWIFCRLLNASGKFDSILRSSISAGVSRAFATSPIY